MMYTALRCQLTEGLWAKAVQSVSTGTVDYLGSHVVDLSQTSLSGAVGVRIGFRAWNDVDLDAVLEVWKHRPPMKRWQMCIAAHEPSRIPLSYMTSWMGAMVENDQSFVAWGLGVSGSIRPFMQHLGLTESDLEVNPNNGFRIDQAAGGRVEREVGAFSQLLDQVRTTSFAQRAAWYSVALRHNGPMFANEFPMSLFEELHRCVGAADFVEVSALGGRHSGDDPWSSRYSWLPIGRVGDKSRGEDRVIFLNAQMQGASWMLDASSTDTDDRAVRQTLQRVLGLDQEEFRKRSQTLREDAG